MLFNFLSDYYTGFYLTKPVGNNAFSFEQRKQQKIYIAPIIKGGSDDLAVGKKIVFSEIENGKEINKPGLPNFIYLQNAEKDIFIFDNHNHAFFFWIAALKAGKLQKGLPLVHIDQHSDMRKPQRFFDFNDTKNIGLQKAFEYTNFELNVGNFIQPALEIDLFSSVEIIDNSAAFETSFEGEFVLDIDVDIFSEDMAYINYDLKMEFIKRCLHSARLITIATSPYFIEQGKAIRVVKELLQIVERDT